MLINSTAWITEFLNFIGTLKQKRKKEKKGKKERKKKVNKSSKFKSKDSTVCKKHSLELRIGKPHSRSL